MSGKHGNNQCSPVLPAPVGGLVPLSALQAGERAEVAQVLCGHGLMCRMTSLGFTPGVEVTVVQNYGRGPLIAQVRGARVAMGRGEAGRLQVRRKIA